ncbi:MAG TPA: FUSC family protein [Dictyobacter sp.]|nr:FUSC family protein [Dictyobacter sp.]
MDSASQREMKPDHNIPLQTRIASWWNAFIYAWHTAMRINTSQLTFSVAIRCVVGLILPLLLGQATGHLVQGVIVAAGALSAGTVGLAFTHRARIRTMLYASIAIGFSASIGGLVSLNTWLTMLALGVWGLGAGLLASMGQPALLVGLQAATALIIFSHFAVTPVQALLEAPLMFAGALLQILLALLPWPGQHSGVERTALSHLFQALSDYAKDPLQSDTMRRMSNVLTQTETVLADSTPRGEEQEAYHSLFLVSESLRLELAILVAVEQRLQQSGEHERLQQCISSLRQILASATEIFHAYADHLLHLRSRLDTQQYFRQLDAALASLRQAEITPIHEKHLLQQLILHAERLVEQCHAVEQIFQSWSKLRSHHSFAFRRNRVLWKQLQLQHPFSVMRANISLHSTAFQHALRLSVTLLLAGAIYRFTPLDRGYWVPLTALLVLRPDFTTTFSRGVARLLGTLLGSICISLFFLVFHPGVMTMIALIAVLAFFSYGTLLANYGIFSFLIAAEAILLITFVDPHSVTNGVFRGINTIIGGVLVLLIYVIWPSWARSQLLPNLRQRVDAIRVYFVTVMDAYIHPTQADTRQLEKARHKSRLARTNAESAIESTLNEPGNYFADTNLAQTVMAATDQFAQQVLLLEGSFLDAPPHRSLPMLKPFCQAVDQILQKVAMLIAGKESDASFPDLRQIVKELERVCDLDSDDDDEVYADLDFVLMAAERMVDSIEMITDLVGSMYTKTAHQQEEVQTDAITSSR